MSRRQALQQILNDEHSAAMATASGQPFLQHRLRVAEVELHGHLVYCASCGAYAWASTRSLMHLCRGKAFSPGKAAQRARLAAGVFPSSKRPGWKVGRAFPATEAVVDFLHMIHRGQAQRTGTPQQESGDPCPAACLSFSRERLLRAYGLTEDSFQALVRKTEQAEQALIHVGQPENEPESAHFIDSESDDDME